MSGAQEPATGRIITFYAYKGGVGRTLALANIARFLAERRGLCIGMVDLDTEAPGLSHEPLCAAMGLDPRLRQGPERVNQDFQKRIDSNPGFLELFNRIGENQELSDVELHARLHDHVIRMPVLGDGSLLLMPTARESRDPGASFRDSLDRFRELVAKDSDLSVSTRISRRILHAFMAHFHLDFLFIDGRTGYDRFFHIYNLSLPHAVLIFTALTYQSLQGNFNLLMTPAPSGKKDQIPVFIVASPTPTVNPNELESRLRFTNRTLRNIQMMRESDPDTRFIYSMPSEISVFLHHSDLAQCRETYFLDAFPDSLLARDYRNLAEQIQRLTLDNKAFSQIEHDRNPVNLGHRFAMALKALKPEGGPLEFAVPTPVAWAVEEALQHWTREALGPSGFEDIAGGPSGASGRHRGIPGLIHVRSWDPGDDTAPWSQDASGGCRPDLVAYPHSWRKSIQQHLDVLDLDRYCNESSGSPVADLPVFDPGNLDHYYSGWREWCIYDRRLTAFPFCATTTLLAANEDLLRGNCEAYWKRSGVAAADRASFLPSSWRRLSALVEANRPSDPANLPIVTSITDRGLFFAWLSVIYSIGGWDGFRRRGRPLDVQESKDRSREVTMTFIRILRHGLPGEPRALDDERRRCDTRWAVRKFAYGEAAMLLAWSDLFHFNWFDQPPMLESSKLARAAGSKDGSELQKELRLARLPGDVRYRSHGLLDQWMVSVVKSKSVPAFEDDRTQAACTLMTLFLHPDVQLDLLRQGFPTASLPMIQTAKQEVEKSRLEEDARLQPGRGFRPIANYVSFLSVLENALSTGWQVPTPENPGDYDAVGRALWDGATHEFDDGTVWEMVESATGKLGV